MSLPRTSVRVIVRARGEKGQSLVEFAICALLTVMLLLGVVEFGRMILAYTTLNSATRIGVRYAMVHGSSDPARLASTTAIENVVRDYMGAAAINTASATVNVTYPGYTPLGCAVGAKTPGCPVKIVVSYPYQTMVTYFPISVTLASRSQGVITF